MYPLSLFLLHTHTFRLFLAQVLLDLFTALSFTQLLDLPLVQRLLLNTRACISACLGIYLSML